ncbi:hypothetical protein AB0C07_10875 [Actinoplanes missouriensis]|uniref:hypothetical protein n=1 Tax=Actinoplanes missouriensis TaxID=1866 RepID=UPI0033FB6C3E
MALRRLLLAAVLLSLLVVTAACKAEEGGDVQPTETKAEASRRVDALVEEAFAQLPPGATRKPNVNVDSVPCDDPTDGGPAGRIFAERRDLIVPPSGGAWPVTDVFPTLIAFWEQQGYTTRIDGRSEREPRYSVGTPDGYIVIVNSWDRGDHVDISLGSTSPCIWENGTPDPQ